MADNGNKIARFNLNDEQGLRAVARALSSEIRLAILRTLQTGNKSIGELSEALQVPMSTISTSVSILAEAGLQKPYHEYAGRMLFGCAEYYVNLWLVQ